MWILRCQYCGSLFPYISQPNLWRMLRARGIPREVVRDLQRSLCGHLFSVMARPHTEEEAKVAIEAHKAELERRVQLIGKDIAFVDGSLYRKEAKAKLK